MSQREVMRELRKTEETAEYARWDPFWGCENYSEDGCKGSRNIMPDGRPEEDETMPAPTFGKGDKDE